MTENHTNAIPEIARDRFAFGRNWSDFVTGIDEGRIASAQRSLCDLLQVQSLAGRRFLDIGCGSGLSSLVARRLGAEVLSFDYDTQSVSASLALKERYAPGDPRWRIEQGSAVDAAYLESLGTWDVVYSWGVLHHTGSMWTSIDLVSSRVAPGGLLGIAIYNDQGPQSRLWGWIKRTYVKVPPLRPLLLVVSAPMLWGPSFARATARWQAKNWWTEYRNERGMSRWHDLVDWVGGYPFEVASPQKVVRFCEARGFRLERLISTRRLGCNQFSLRRVDNRPDANLVRSLDPDSATST